MALDSIYNGTGAMSKSSGNYREIQRSDARTIRFFDVDSSCKEAYEVPKTTNPNNGHYERITK